MNKFSFVFKKQCKVNKNISYIIHEKYFFLSYSHFDYNALVYFKFRAEFSVCASILQLSSMLPK